MAQAESVFWWHGKGDQTLRVPPHFPSPQVRKGKNIEKAGGDHRGEAQSARGGGRRARRSCGLPAASGPCLRPVLPVPSLVGMWASGQQGSASAFHPSSLRALSLQPQQAAGARLSLQRRRTGCPGVAASENRGGSTKEGSSAPSCEPSSQERRI